MTPANVVNAALDTYKATWNARATTLADGMRAVDGSASQQVLALTGAFTAAQVRAALDLQPGDHVFEIGCGVGRIGRLLAPELAQWHGLDIAERMVAHTRQALAGVPGALASPLMGSALPMLEDASMDKGYSVAVFIHLDKEDVNLYLREVARVLRPGGLFYFDTWNLSHPVGWQRFAYEVDEAAKADPTRRKDVARNQFCTPEEIRLYVRAAGLELVFEDLDSHWIQVVARRPDIPMPPGIAPCPLSLAGEETARRLASRRASIGYSPRWVQCFSEACEVLLGRVNVQTMLDRWRAEPGPPPEVVLHIAWLEGLGLVDSPTPHVVAPVIPGEPA